MMPGDITAFTEVFNGIRAIFPLRADKAELSHIIRLYFRALESFSIAQVEAGATAWQSDGTKFPKPKEWKSAIPREGSHVTLHELEAAEASDHRRALANHFADDPCSCFLCHQAGVAHRLLRFVPLQEADGRDARGSLDGKAVTRGYWAHGEELRAWYEARDAFQALNAQFAPRSMPRLPKPAAFSPATQAIVEIGHEMQATIARCDEAERIAAEALEPAEVA